MKQLKMQAIVAERKEERALPQGYAYEKFGGSLKDIRDWEAIIEESFGACPNAEGYFQASIAQYLDCVPTQDVWFVVNEKGERVATITTITHKDGSGYVHMVGAKSSEQGKGLGHSMARYALKVFATRGVERVVLTTDDFRFAAIKTYLGAGFIPVIYHDDESDMYARWDLVLKKLGYAQVKRIEKNQFEFGGERKI